MGSAPKLIPISQCNKGLRFDGGPHWPPNVPAIAINGVVIAGFNQKLAINHVLHPAETETILELVLSVYPRMTILEAKRFTENAREFKWIPMDLLNDRWNAHPSRQPARTETLKPIREWLDRALRPTAIPHS